VAGGKNVERRVPLRYRRFMNLDQVELLITILSLLLAVASLYLVVKRGGWELPGSA